MVFDGSCWATDAITDQLMYTNGEAYRRPKIDFFNTNLNMNPIACGENRTNNVVSHLSSNGYYGYAHVTRSHENEATVDATDDAMNVSDNYSEQQQQNEEPIFQHQQEQQEPQQQQQQHLLQQQYNQQQALGAMESRKRDRCQQQTNEYPAQAKRFRCTNEHTTEGT